MMPFFLKRGGSNIPLEVQRWQYFLLKQGIPQAGAIDAQFPDSGPRQRRSPFKCGTGSRLPGQLDKNTLHVAKTLGYSVKPDDYYDNRGGEDYMLVPGGAGGLCRFQVALRVA
jgi:hypothetical protein